MRVPAGFSTAFLCSVLLVLPGFAQGAPAASSQPEKVPSSPPEKISEPSGVADHTISLDVEVTDKKGNPVPGLQEQDFAIVDGKKPTKITSFHASAGIPEANDPQRAILVVDAVNTSYVNLQYAQQQLTHFLRKDDGRLPVPMSLVVVTDTEAQVQPNSTSDGNELADTLNSNQTGLRVIGRSQGFYGAGERLDLSLRMIENLARYETTQPGRKLVIWISPGWPLLSGPRIELTTKMRESAFHSIVTLSQELRDARIVLYSVDPLGTADSGGGRIFYYQAFLKGVTSAKQVDYGNLALQVLATQSGGRVLNSSNDVASLVATALSDAKSYYTLSFVAPPADHPDEYHALEVKVDKSGLIVRTRTGYYAQPYAAAR